MLSLRWCGRSCLRGSGLGFEELFGLLALGAGFGVAALAGECVGQGEMGFGVGGVGGDGGL